MIQEQYEEVNVLYDGPVEELSDSSWYSPSSSRNQSRSESRVSQITDQQKSESPTVKRKKTKSTPQSNAANVTNSLQEVLTNATSALSNLQAKNTSPVNSNHFFAQ